MKSESVSHSVVSNSWWLHGLQPTKLLCPWNSLGKNTGVDIHSLLRGILLTQGQNLSLQHCRQILYHLNHEGNPHGGCRLSCFSRVRLCNPVDCSSPGSSVLGFPMQEYWSELPFPSPGYLPDSGIEPESLISPALAGRFFTTSATGNHRYNSWRNITFS